MTDDSSPIYAFVLDGNGGGRAVGWEEIRAWAPDEGLLWVHVDPKDDKACAWLENESGLDELAVEALLAEETRPRCTPLCDGLLTILRGVNMNPGQEAEDMVSLRIWTGADRIVSARLRRVMAAGAMRDAVESGRGPFGPGDFLSEIAERLVQNMEPAMDKLDEELDVLEAEDETPLPPSEKRRLLGRLRRQAIALRRHLAPQRQALSHLYSEKVEWLSDAHRREFRELADRVTRYVEDLDALRERAAVLQDEVTNRMGEQMNRTMYMLSLIATVFLPLGFLTGLLGVNVGGIPGTENPWGFGVVVVVLVLLGVLEVFLLRRLKWF